MRFANKQFSTATLNPEHLLECALEYLDDLTYVRVIKNILAGQEKYWSASEYWTEIIFDKLSDMAEEGYCFGATEGNGSDIGWWPLQGYNIPENWNASKNYCLKVVLPPESSPAKVMVIESGDRKNGWVNRAQFSNKEWVLNPFLKAEHVTELCRYEDIEESMRINRECDILADMLEYASEKDDSEFMEEFSVWFEAHGFSTRAKLFNL